MSLSSIATAMLSGRLRISELLGGTLLLAAGMVAWHFATPWIMPLRVVEGPFVQRAERDGLTITWFTSRAAECAIEVAADAGPRSIPARREGNRLVATVDGLAPAQAYQYTLKSAGRTLPEVGGVAHTAPPATKRSGRFVVFGDSGHGYREQYALAAKIAEAQPDMLVHTGDLIYPGGERRHYRDRFFVPYRKLLEQVAFWPSVGNHDARSIAVYLDIFDLPTNGPAGLPAERHYWFDWGAARFVVIDSNATDDELEKTIAPWMERVFADFAGDWRFAVFHHPPHTAGKYEPDVGTLKLVPAMQRAGVDVVFNGHDHMYERTHPLLDGGRDDARGTVYIVSGAGGASLYEPRNPGPPPPTFAVRHFATHSFTTIEFSAEQLRVMQTSIDGSILDEWTLPHRSSRAAATRPNEGQPTGG